MSEAGILHVFSPMDLPEGNSASGVDLQAFVGVGATEGAIVGVCDLESEQPLFLATAEGIVKRVKVRDLPEKAEHAIITLKDGDRLVQASPGDDSAEVVLITSQAQLLRFQASAIRPQGPAASGMAGISIPEGAKVLWAGCIAGAGSEVVTVSGSTEMLPGTETHRVKRTALSDFPAKGRATQGVRCHAFLKGEDAILLAHVGSSPVALGEKGDPIELPTELAKRDASGTPVRQPIRCFGDLPD